MFTRGAILAFTLLALSNAQESATTLANPFTSEADRADGERIFLSQCASCHARDGRGTSAGPDLTTGSFRHAASDEGLYRVVTKGIPGTTMPAFSLNSRPAWQVVAFLRSLSRGHGSLVTGDAARGAGLFRANHCAGCHSFWAPDLARMASRRTLEELRGSILDPQADVHSDYWRLRVTTRDGRRLSGHRLNEDSRSIQFRDEKGALRSVLKTEIAGYEIDRSSPMPSFRGKLTGAEVDDLLAFLTKGALP